MTTSQRIVALLFACTAIPTAAAAQSVEPVNIHDGWQGEGDEIIDPQELTDEAVELIAEVGSAIVQLRFTAAAAAIDPDLTDVVGETWCTGAVVAPRVILTAGHCVPDDDVVTELRAVFGHEYEYSAPGEKWVVEKPGTEIAIVGTIGKKYSTWSGYDGGLLKLAQPAPTRALGLASAPIDDGLDLWMVHHSVTIGYGEDPPKLAEQVTTDDLVGGNRFRYLTSVAGEHGASGAPLINADGAIVGVFSGWNRPPNAPDRAYFSPIHSLLKGFSALDDYLPRADFNGDGFSDLAVGIPHEDIGNITNAGRVEVMYGSLDGLDIDGARRSLHQDTAGILGAAEAGDQFGGALAVGDFDCDHIADLAVGVPYENKGNTVDTGAVNILFGSPNGLSTVGDQMFDESGVGLGAQAVKNNRFGRALAAGDFDRNGCDDLAIGAPDSDYVGMLPPFYAEGAGSVVILMGSTNGLKSGHIRNANTLGVSVPVETDGWFGARLAAGDFDGNGYDDLVVGIPHATVANKDAAGAVAVLWGGPFQPLNDADTYHQDSSSVQGTTEDGDKFGDALAVGDFDGDSYDDLAVGVQYEDLGSKTNAGLVTLFMGRSWGGLHAEGDDSLTQNESGFGNWGAEPGDRFGAALTAGDFDCDGRDDLAVGAPGEDLDGKNKAGAVFVTYGSTGDSWRHANGGRGFGQESLPGGYTETNDGFGQKLSVGDFDSDGCIDLVVGTPGENWTVGGTTTNDTGVVEIIPGGAAGLELGDAEQAVQLGGALEVGDRYGSALP